MNWEALWKYMWCCWTFLGSLMVAFTEAISGYKRLTLKSILRYVKIRSKYHILHCGTKPAVYCVDHVAQCQKPSTPVEAILCFCTPSRSSPIPPQPPLASTCRFPWLSLTLTLVLRRASHHHTFLPLIPGLSQWQQEVLITPFTLFCLVKSFYCIPFALEIKFKPVLQS